MKVYISRVAEAESGDASSPLTPVGERQAECLSAHLSRLSFSGKVLCAPTAAARQTAKAILGTDAEDSTFLRDRGKDESTDELLFRVEEGLRPLLAKTDDVLLVTYGPVLSALRKLLAIDHFLSVTGYHASLSFKDTETQEGYINDPSYLPTSLRTARGATYDSLLAHAEETIEDGVRFFDRVRGARILHIGDTYSFHYDFYRLLIERTRPDILLHTGDMADELKAGRLPSHMTPWENTVPRIIGIMESSSASRVLLVPGNNDLTGALPAMLRRTELIPAGTVLTQGEHRVLLAHAVYELKKDADIYLYGHGLSGEKRTREAPYENGKYYFNASWGISLHDGSDMQNYIILDNPRF